MLRAIHNVSQTWLVKILMLFLVGTFAIWGVGDIFRGNPMQRTIACIGGFYVPFNFFFNSGAAICTGERITVQALEEEFQRNYDTLRRQSGMEINRNLARKLGLMNKTLDALIMQILFDREVTGFGLKYHSDFILRQIAGMPELLTADGKFNEENFRRAVNDMHMTEAGFIDHARRTMQRETFIAALSDGAAPPAAYMQQLLEAEGQERTTQILRLAHNSIPAPPVPGEAEIGKFHESHADSFKTPERRSIGILKILLEDVAQNTVISDHDLASAFAKRQDEFARPERRDLLQTVMSSEAEAKKLAQAAAAGKSLKRAAEKMQKPVITLEDQTEQNILPALFANVFAADAGAVIGPVKSDFGWHVIQLTKIKPPVKPVLDKIKAQLRGKLQMERAAEEIQTLANKIDDDLAGGKSLDDIAQSRQLRAVQFGAIDATGKTEDGKESGLPAPDLTLKNAFALNEGESSSLLDDSKGNFFVVHVDKIIPAHVPPVAAVKNRVAEAWRADRQTQAAAAMAEEIAAVWRQKPGDFAGLGKRRGVTVMAGEPVSLLGEFNKNLPSSMREQIFDLKSGEIAIGADEGAHYIGRLSGRKPVDPAKHQGMQETLKKNVPKEWKDDLLKQYENVLKQRFSVRINQVALDEFLSRTGGEE